MTAIQADVVLCLFMNILIEDAEKLEYLTSANLWTKNPAEGKDFVAAKAAVVIAKQEPIGKFNIVAYFSTTKQLINMDHGRGKDAAEANPA